MGYHPRIETSEIATHITTRTRNSELWFVNNKFLEKEMLGIIAKASTKREVKLYAVGIQGNHVHQAVKCPKSNRADYTRDVNSSIAKAIPRHYNHFSGGLWHRRYSAEYMSHPEDIEKYFFYIALQPVNHGLVDRISDYPGYNFFNDAISGISRKFKVLNRTEIYKAKKDGRHVNIKDYIEIYELRYERLPGYEDLSQDEYKRVMIEKLEVYRLQVLRERAERGKQYALGKEKLKTVKPGSLPRNTKITDEYGHRPRVLSVCYERRRIMEIWYFSIYFDYKEASVRYRQGDYSVEFPPGTYKPPKFTCACEDTLESIAA